MFIPRRAIIRWFCHSRRRLCALAVCTFCVSFWLLKQLWFKTDIKNQSQIKNFPTVLCDYGPQLRENLVQMVINVQQILSNLNVSYFACYGTLWALIRRKELYFPWSNSVQLCVRNEQLSQVDEGLLTRYFRRFNLYIEYDAIQGVYTVVKLPDSVKRQNGSVELIVYEEEQSTVVKRYQVHNSFVRRVGLKNRILPQESDILEKFPSLLVDPPLESIEAKSGNVQVPVPHEKFEIQKYLYKNDWWKERKPCAG